MTILSMTQPELGRVLRDVRGSAGLTQARLAERCGLHWVQISGIENGRRMPSLQSLNRILAACGKIMVVKDLTHEDRP